MSPRGSQFWNDQRMKGDFFFSGFVCEEFPELFENCHENMPVLTHDLPKRSSLPYKHIYTDVFFCIIKRTRCTSFSNLFWNENLHVSDSSSVHHQEFFTAHTAMVYVIQVCWQLASRIICSCSQAVCKPVWHIPLLCVQWKTPDDVQRNCLRHVDFHSKINLRN